MDPLPILFILTGILIITTRGPLIFAPTASMQLIRQLVSTERRIRLIGLAIAPLALAFLFLPLGDGGAAGFLRVLGWIFAAAVLWLSLLPETYRLVALIVVDYFESSVDMAAVRIIGCVAVAIGGAMVYAGLFVL